MLNSVEYTEDLRRRAFAAYFGKYGAQLFEGKLRSEVVSIGIRVYVIIWVNKEILVVFRVDSYDGHLCRISRYPPAINTRQAHNS